MTSLTKEQGTELVAIARNAIGLKLGLTEGRLSSDDPALQEKGGTFVTLKKDNMLRGCIGNIEPVGPVIDSVRENAVNAAFNDFRFSPLSVEEFSKTRISVSVLTPAVPLSYEDGDDLTAKLRPGVDGVILRAGRNSATFLPQVWEQLPDPNDFLDHLSLKAGVAREVWRTGEAEILLYQVQDFKEENR